jgi:opacity protein-like surface antigen
MRHALAATVACCVIVAAPREAAAIERQHHLGLDPSLAMLKVGDKSSVSAGVGIGAHYTYGINDQFNFMAEVNGSRVAADQEQDTPTTPHTRPADIGYASAAVGYVIDILRWVPYIGLLAGGYRLSGGTLEKALLLPGLELAVGLDYQLSRHWAVGLAGRQHLMFTEASTYPSYTNVLLRLEYMWGF